MAAYSSQNNVVTSDHNSHTTDPNPRYRKKHRIGPIGFLLHASLSRRRGGKRPGAGGNYWRTGGRYATSGVGLWPTRRTASKLSVNLWRGVYAECTLASSSLGSQVLNFVEISDGKLLFSAVINSEQGLKIYAFN